MNSRTFYRRKPKFTVGAFLISADQVISIRDAGGWIWFGTDSHARVYSSQWIANMNFGCVMAYLRTKQLAHAIRNPEYPYVFRARRMESHVPEKASEWWATCTEIPSARIVENTKDAVCMMAEAAAREHAKADTVRVQVNFEYPEIETRKAAAMLTA